MVFWKSSKISQGLSLPLGPPTSHLAVLTLTSLHDSRLVARTHREHLKHTAGGPQKLLIAVVPHDLHKSLGSPIGQDDQLLGEGRGGEGRKAECKTEGMCGGDKAVFTMLPLRCKWLGNENDNNKC